VFSRRLYLGQVDRERFNRYNKWMKNFFYCLPENFRKSFSGSNIRWHLLAILLTYLLVISGADWQYFLSSQNSSLQTFLFPAVILGGVVPMFSPFILWTLGVMRKNLQIKNMAFALGQAALLGWFISSCYKAFTGRIPPAFRSITENAADITREFHFGFFREGIFWGWPSSHTVVAFAMAVSLFFLFPQNSKVKYAVLVYAFYVGLGVSVSIHWLSDFVAGAIIGSVIGAVVGKSFLDKLANEKAPVL
jgi:membrane-associated phospholipid phosphatase